MKKHPKYIKTTISGASHFGKVTSTNAGSRKNEMILKVQFVKKADIIDIGWPPNAFCDCSPCVSAIEISKEEYIAALIIES